TTSSTTQSIQKQNGRNYSWRYRVRNWLAQQKTKGLTFVGRLRMRDRAQPSASENPVTLIIMGRGIELQWLAREARRRPAIHLQHWATDEVLLNHLPSQLDSSRLRKIENLCLED